MQLNSELVREGSDVITSKDGYFAASNSGRGFKNYYSEVFGEAERIFVIKGGPGTGKSRFIRDVAQHATEFGWTAEYYNCSSDASSLDGVLLKKDGSNTAIIDGTPPHAWEPTEPGVREEIINLGSFWDGEKLRASGEEISNITRRRGELWRRAYRWLSGCLDMCDIIKEVGASCAIYGSISDTATSMLAGLPQGSGWSIRPALIWSVGMGGAVSSVEYIKNAEKLYIIKDKYMSAHLLIRELRRISEVKKLPVIISYDPIDTDQPDGLFIEEGRVAMVVADTLTDRAYIPVDMEDLISTPSRGLRAQVEHAERCRGAMLGGAIDTLAEIKKCHFRLEEIYTAAMDFQAKEAFVVEFCKKYFPN